MASLLLCSNVAFRATLDEDGCWDVVVGDSDHGYVSRRGLQNWMAVEEYVWRKAKSLYGIDKDSLN